MKNQDCSRERPHKTEIKKISLKDYFGDSLKNRAFSTLEEIEELLESTPESTHMVPRYIISRQTMGDVITLKVMLKYGKTLYIRINVGIPDLEDFADVAYEDGKHADIRVLVSTDYHINNDPEIKSNASLLFRYAEYYKKHYMPILVIGAYGNRGSIKLHEGLTYIYYTDLDSPVFELIRKSIKKRIF